MSRRRRRNRHRARNARGETYISAQQQQQFLDALSEGWSATRAAQVAGVPRTTLYKFKERDPVFRGRWEAAVESGTDRLEDEATRRGVEGWDEPVFQKGEQVGTIRKYDSTLLMMQLNGRRPDKYRPAKAAADDPFKGRDAAANLRAARERVNAWRLERAADAARRGKPLEGELLPKLPQLPQAPVPLKLIKGGS